MTKADPQRGAVQIGTRKRRDAWSGGPSWVLMFRAKLRALAMPAIHNTHARRINIRTTTTTLINSFGIRWSSRWDGWRRLSLDWPPTISLA